MSVHKIDTTDIDNGLPMMATEEINIINNLLAKHKPKYCLEWGSGMSTVYFPTRHKFIKTWLSVEHNGHFLDYIQDKCPDNVQTLWVLPGSSYADIVQRSNKQFDFIFIDGLDRPKCLQNALKIISDEGIILLHDAGRQEHDGIIKQYNGEVLIQGEKPVKEGGYAHRGLALFRRQDSGS